MIGHDFARVENTVQLPCFSRHFARADHGIMEFRWVPLMNEMEKANNQSLMSVFEAFDERVKALENDQGSSPSNVSARIKKRLVAQVLATIDLDDYATKAQLATYVPKSELNQPAPGTALHHLMGMRAKAGNLETTVTDPAGALQRLVGRLETLKKKR